MLSLINGARNMSVPSHVMYVDGLMIFYKGILFNVKQLKDIFDIYSLIFGQFINSSKSTIYFGRMSSRKQNINVDLLVFVIDNPPFMYLGIPIFRGKPKIYYF